MKEKQQSKKRHYHKNRPSSKKHNAKHDTKGRRSDKSHAKKHNRRLTNHFFETSFKCKVSGKLKISLGLVGALEFLAVRTKEKIKVLKGYEAPEAVDKKSFRKNYHSLGVAADIQIGSMSLRDMFLMAKSIKEFKGIGINLDENYIHVDSRKQDVASMWFEKEGAIIPYDDEKFEQYLPKSTEEIS